MSAANTALAALILSRGNVGAFGDLVEAGRKRAGLTQEQLAELAGVTQSAVSQWEQGGTWPKTRTVRSIASAIGVSADELLRAIEADLADLPRTPTRKAGGKRWKRGRAS